MAWRIGTAAFLVQSTFDLAIGLARDQFTLKWLTENLAGNFLGAILLAMVTVGIFAAADFVFGNVPASPTSQRVVAALSIVLGGLICSCIAYYAGDILYKPLPVTLDAYFAAPVGGSATPAVAASAPIATSASTGPSFSFVPDTSMEGVAAWTSPYGTVRAKMLEKPSGKKPTVTVSLVGDCMSADAAAALEASVPWLVVEKVSALDINFDAGPTDLVTLSGSGQTSRFKIDTGGTTTFSLDQDQTTKNIKVTHFVGDAASLDVRSDGRHTSFLLAAPLFGTNLEKLALGPRVLTIKVGQQTTLLKFVPPKLPAASARLKCHPLEILPSFVPNHSMAITIESKSAFPGALVTISEASEDETLRFENGGIHVTGGSGWIAVSGLPPAKLVHHGLGNLSMIQFRGNVTDLIVDSSTLSARPLDTYTAYGHFDAVYGEQGRVRVVGRASHLWKDQGRLNSTRWENLGWEVKIFLISMLGSAIAFFAHIALTRLRSNKRFSWMT